MPGHLALIEVGFFLIQEIIQSDLFNGKAAHLHNSCFMEEGDLRQGRVFEDKHEQYAQS